MDRLREDRKMKKGPSRSLLAIGSLTKKKKDKHADEEEISSPTGCRRVDRRATVNEITAGAGGEFKGSTFTDVAYDRSDVFYRTAFNSMKIEDIFNYLDSLASDDAAQKGRLLSEGKKASAALIQKDIDVLVKRVKKFLSILLQFKTIEKAPSYAMLFHSYMAAGKADVQNLLSPAAVHSYIELLSLYVHQEAMAESKQTSSPAQEMVGTSHMEEAKDLLRFLESHRLDPYSCLVGLTPCKDIMTMCVDSTQVRRSPAGHGISGSEVMQNVLRWALAKDPKEVMREISQCAAIIRGVTAMQRGELLICQTDGGDYAYARYAGVFDTHAGRADVFLSAEEEVVSVPIHKVYPLTKEAVALIKSKDTVMSMEKLALSPVDALYAEMMTLGRETAYHLLEEKGVKKTTLDRAKRTRCSILELADLKHAQDMLATCNPPPESVVNNLAAAMDARVSSFLASVDRKTLFQPTCAKVLSQLETFQSTAFLVMELQRCKGSLQSAMDQVALQKRDLVNGTRKNQLVEWWLSFISQTVDRKLASLGYHADAVPDNYTSEPPSSIGDVYENVKILGELLNTKQDVHRIQETMLETMETIYPKIDSFIVDAKISVLEYLGEPCGAEGVENFNQAKAEKMLKAKAKKENLERKTFVWVSDLLKDLQYLTTMVYLESDDCTEEERRKHFHIVPISGLFISALCRMENECKTVLELWAPAAYVRKIANDGDRAAIYRAISANDVREVKGLLSKEDCNQQDERGWTPLHYAASREETLKCCVAILMSSVKKINVNLQNDEGNTLLHFVSRIRCKSSENSRAVQEHIVGLITTLGCDLKLRNNVGETALHTACNQGNLSIARTLLEGFADPNALTVQGATCLHYAVQANSPEIIALLLEFGANPFIAADNCTAMDLALKLNFTNAAKAIASGTKAQLHATSKKEKRKTKSKKR